MRLALGNGAGNWQDFLRFAPATAEELKARLVGCGWRRRSDLRKARRAQSGVTVLPGAQNEKRGRTAAAPGNHRTT